MDKVDRLGWAAGFSFRSHGLHLGVRANDPSTLDDIKQRLPPGWKPQEAANGAPVAVDALFSLLIGRSEPDSHVRRYSLVYGDAARLARTLDPKEALDTLEMAVHQYVSLAARGRVFVHAGVVGWDGKAIVIPGSSFNGKSTLVAALVRAGATYYSDEYAVFDSLGRVHPFPRALALRKENDARQTRYAAEALGGRTGTTPLPVGTVLVTQYKQGSRWRPRRLSQGQAALGLMAHAPAARHKPRYVLSTLSRAVLGASAFKGARGEAEEMVEFLLDRRSEAA
ncbi:MAG: hypothetical protein HYX97_04850 [Chloroflexi bacterium]|nr:hypothetical protein [Chloroflexota bacterium]